MRSRFGVDGDSVPDGCDQCPDADDLADADGDGFSDCLPRTALPAGRICGLGFPVPAMVLAFVLWPRRRQRRR